MNSDFQLRYIYDLTRAEQSSFRPQQSSKLGYAVAITDQGAGRGSIRNRHTVWRYIQVTSSWIRQPRHKVTVIAPRLGFSALVSPLAKGGQLARASWKSAEKVSNTNKPPYIPRMTVMM